MCAGECFGVTHLINLLSWLPGHSGFSSYVQRVVPGIDGLRLQLGEDAQAVLLTPEQWSLEPPAWASRRMMRFCSATALCSMALIYRLCCNAMGSN